MKNGNNTEDFISKQNKTEKNINNKIQIALEALFFCDFYISLKDYSFEVYKAQPYMTELLENCEDAIAAANAYVKYMVAEESKEKMSAFLDLKTLKERMKNVSVLDCVYNDPNIGWSKAVFTVVDRNEEGEAKNVALLVEAISQENNMTMVESQMKHSLEMEAGLWNSVKKLVTSSDIKASTDSIIREVMDYYNADRAYIFEFDWEKQIGNNTYEVCASNVEPMIDTLQEVPLEAMDVWIKMFNKKSIILIKDLNELIGDESRKDEYDILAPQGIKSLISAPVYYEGKLVGLLGVDNPKRNLEDTTYIKSLAFFCVKVSIKEKEIAALEKKNMLDPLTGVYNRQGYEEIKKHIMKDNQPIAYAQIDIDNFKDINDTYGHELGDEVLKIAALQLKEAFRSNNYVIRFGGDEFGVFLTNYSSENWEKFGDKLRMIHIQMNLILKKEIYVTLSVGICWSPSGFKDEMISLADAALYRVKNNGRAGCCIFDTESNIMYEWKDEIESNLRQNIFEQNNTGSCRVEFPNGDVKNGRLICNETARSIMGFGEKMTPEECLKTWYERVDKYYKDEIEKVHEELIEKGQIEWSYMYNHPVQGQIMVRSGGRCQKTKEGIVFYGYHQSLQGTCVFIHQDDSQKLIEAMTSLYFASYYVDLKKDKYFMFKSTSEAKKLEKQNEPATVAVRNYVQTLIQTEYQEKMMKFFELSTVAERLKDVNFVETEYQSKIVEKGWCRARILAVKRDGDGVVTHIQILVGSIDKDKNVEL